ncbi:MAG: acyltransferase family protein [Proteobacteria bacterium]|nr:acyltransferase family protein [Pseudomonadota bacterium]
MSQPSVPQRLHALDNLRACMMWLGIVLHVAVIHWVGDFPLPWRDPQTTPLANFLFAVIHAFRMPVFFIVAGFFVALLIERRGCAGMMKNRLLRIGVPFVLFWPLLYMVSNLLIGLFLNRMADAGTGLPLSMMPGDGRPLVSTMHLWFLYDLFWFSILAGVVGLVSPYVPAAFMVALAAGWRRLACAWWGVIVLTLPLAALGFAYPQGLIAVNGAFLPRLGEVLGYGLYFAFGLALHRQREVVLAQYVRHCWRYFGAGLLCFLVSLPLFALMNSGSAHAGSVQQIKLGIGLSYYAAGWLWSFALIGTFLRYLPERNRVLAYVSDSAYWVYLVHLPVTIGFGLLLVDAPFGALAKMAINIAATTLLCLGSYHLLVRFTLLGELLNGRRHAYRGMFTPWRAGLTLAALFACFIVFTQIKFPSMTTPTRTHAPDRIAVSADVGAFLQALGKAYGDKDSAAVERFLSKDFLHQGMDKAAFLDHLKAHRRDLGTLDIVPVALQQEADKNALRLIAYATSPHGALAPSLQLLPLHAGASIVKEEGGWKLRGNQQYSETGLYKQLALITADFAPTDLDLYKKLIPAGYVMPPTPYVRVAVTDMQDMDAPLIPYRLMQLSILVSKDGVDIWYLLAMPETDWLAVEAGKAVGFPKFVADIAIQRSFGNAWQAQLQQQGKPSVEIDFDPQLLTKGAIVNLPSNPNNWLLFDKGTPMTAVMTELTSPLRQKLSYGWITINSHASPWKELLPPGSRAMGMAYEARGPRKLYIQTANDIDMPADMRALFDKLNDAWLRQDMNAVLENFHPAYMVTNQKNLVAMRRLFNVSRSYRWHVKELREDGPFVRIVGEIQTDVGVFPAQTRLLKEEGRWLFYGDGGSMKDRELAQAMPTDTFEASLQTSLAEVREKSRTDHDDLVFTSGVSKLHFYSVLGNTVFQPEGAGPFPALVLLPDCSGRLGEGMRLWVKAALTQGYAVLPVDSMRGQPTNCRAPLKISIARRIKDAYDALGHLRTLPTIDTKRIAVAGFSQGAVVSLLLGSKGVATMYGMRQPGKHDFAAVAALYPLCYFPAYHGAADVEFLRPDTDKPLLALMGGQDIYAPAYDCLIGLNKLKKQGAPVTWQVFPDAGHGWDIPEANGRQTISFRGDIVPLNYKLDISTQSRAAVFAFLARSMEQK